MVGLDEGYARSECYDSVAGPTRDLRRVAAEPSPPDKTRTLAKIIESEIIPRLLLANGRDADRNGFAGAQIDVDSQDIDAFADMMIGLEMDRAHAVVSGALARGVAIETILLEVLAPTAHRLGDRWVEDLCTFTDVTVGLCALQSLLRAYEADDTPELPTGSTGGSVLLAAMPGEQHTFGILMLESFYRRAGWDVVAMPFASEEELVAAAGRKPFTVMGVSLSRESELGRLSALIGRLRKADRSAEAVVMVGGRVFNDTPDLVKTVGADLTAADGRAAVVASQQLLWSTHQTH